MKKHLSYIGSELAQFVVQTSDPTTESFIAYLEENKNRLPRSIEDTINEYRFLRLTILLFVMKDIAEVEHKHGKLFDKLLAPLYENILIHSNNTFPIEEHNVHLKEYLDYSNQLHAALLFADRPSKAIGYFAQNFLPSEDQTILGGVPATILLDYKKIVKQKLDEAISFCNDATFAPVLSSTGLFSFSGRRNRLPYFIINCILIMVFRACEFLFDYPLLSLPAFMATWAVLGLGLYIYLTNTAKRLHDLNHPAWFVLVILAVELLPLIEPALNSICLLARVPIGLYLTFWLGTEGTNQYGCNPILSKTK